MQTILLVEDNEMNRDLISRRLKRRGFEVVVALDGAEGVEKAAAEQPDLVLMDMGLPVIDGYEATRLLKANDKTRHIPVVGLSAHAMSGDADRALDAGCDDYDTKPVEWPRLLDKIGRLLLETRERATQIASRAGAAEAAEVGRRDPAQVLIVDDNAVHRELLTGRLEALGHVCEAVDDGAEALGHLAEKSYDAVLLDVTLPPVDGQPLLERLGALRDGPVVLTLCPIDAIDSAVASLRRGAEDFIPQPFRAEVVEARLASALERRRLRRQQRRGDGEADGGQRRRQLLEVFLPAPLVSELETSGKILPRRQRDVAVMFCEVAGFAQLGEQREPLELLSELQELFVLCEDVAERHGVLKVRTVGAAFVGAAGLFEAQPDGALACVRCALELLDSTGALTNGWSLRIGIHQGPVIAGVVGHRRYQFDLWGETVELAARVKDRGAVGAVNVSGAVWQRHGHQLLGGSLGETARGDESSMALYLVNGLAG